MPFSLLVRRPNLKFTAFVDSHVDDFSFRFTGHEQIAARCCDFRLAKELFGRVHVHRRGERIFRRHCAESTVVDFERQIGRRRGRTGQTGARLNVLAQGVMFVSGRCKFVLNENSDFPFGKTFERRFESIGSFVDRVELIRRGNDSVFDTSDFVFVHQL